MKRVEVVVEREETNSTKFDGVKEWGSAGCFGKGKGKGKGGRSLSASMLSNETNEPDLRLDSATSSRPRGLRVPSPGLHYLPPTVTGVLHQSSNKWHHFSFFTPRIPSYVSFTTTTTLLRIRIRIIRTLPFILPRAAHRFVFACTGHSIEFPCRAS